MQQRGAVSLHLVLTIFLGLGMLLFGVLAILAYSDNTSIHRNLKDLETKAADKAAATQKQADTLANTKANELPYRVYTADPVDGAFSLQIPKNWSLYVGHNFSNQIPLDLAADPNQVTYNLGTGPNIINTHAFHLQLVNESVQAAVKTYDTQIKKKQITSKSVQVSGIAATELQGAIDTQRHNGIVVIVPTRSQTMLLSTDDANNFTDEFNAIIASAKIYP
jgi:hypothetical protein